MAKKLGIKFRKTTLSPPTTTTVSPEMRAEMRAEKLANRLSEMLAGMCAERRAKVGVQELSTDLADLSLRIEMQRCLTKDNPDHCLLKRHGIGFTKKMLSTSLPTTSASPDPTLEKVAEMERVAEMRAGKLARRLLEVFAEMRAERLTKLGVDNKLLQDLRNLPSSWIDTRRRPPEQDKDLDDLALCLMRRRGIELHGVELNASPSSVDLVLARRARNIGTCQEDTDCATSAGNGLTGVLRSAWSGVTRFASGAKTWIMQRPFGDDAQSAGSSLSPEPSVESETRKSSQSFLRGSGFQWKEMTLPAMTAGYTESGDLDCAVSHCVAEVQDKVTELMKGKGRDHAQTGFDGILCLDRHFQKILRHPQLLNDTQVRDRLLEDLEQACGQKLSSGNREQLLDDVATMVHHTHQRLHPAPGPCRAPAVAANRTGFFFTPIQGKPIDDHLGAVRQLSSFQTCQAR